MKGPGLINVSGFHVDPGYQGRLIFSVYNAGPKPSRLHRGQDVFLLWIADLDRPSSERFVKQPTRSPRVSISEDMISKVDRPVHSLQQLSEKVEKLDNELRFFKRVLGVFATIIAISVSSAALVFGAAKYFSETPAP